MIMINNLLFYQPILQCFGVASMEIYLLLLVTKVREYFYSTSQYKEQEPNGILMLVLF